MKQVGLFDAEDKKPITLLKGQHAWWECLEDCINQRDGRVSFLKGKLYRQLKSEDLALENEYGAMVWLTEWKSRFRFHSIKPFDINRNSSLI